MKKFASALVVCVGIMSLLAAVVVASSVRTVRVLDRCEAASFNLAIGPGTCVGDGKITFEEFLEALNPVDFGHDKWSFKFGRGKIDEGETLRATNTGGEFHTFTEVAEYGGGCIPDLNVPLGLTSVPECDALTQVAPGVFVPTAFLTTGINPGTSFDVPGLDEGGTNHKFMCLIHPWMRLDVEVRD